MTEQCTSWWSKKQKREGGVLLTCSIFSSLSHQGPQLLRRLFPDLAQVFHLQLILQVSPSQTHPHVGLTTLWYDSESDQIDKINRGKSNNLPLNLQAFDWYMECLNLHHYSSASKQNLRQNCQNLLLIKCYFPNFILHKFK